ncbi:MAG: TonB-dependent receptor [Gracilimonas sp.]|nr:TonB-dependent receptor [Gracilimonas sp.]
MIYFRGTIFPDTAGNDITNYEYGMFISMETALLKGDLNINSAVRFDKNKNFEPRLSPQTSMNYNMNEDHFFRFSFQHGSRYPGVREQFVNNNLGSALLLGGLSENLAQYDFQENAITLDAVNGFNEAVSERLNESPSSPEAYNRFQAEIENLHILQDGIVQADQLLNINPEVVNTFEIGYKRLFTPELYLDLNYYVSFDKDFIGVTREL